MKNSEYWERRLKLTTEALLTDSEQYAKNAYKQYDMAIRDVEKEISSWYMRLADNNSVTYAEAQKMLSANELKEFHWTVEEYADKCREYGVTGDWLKEIKNASARVHISRLEALKMQLRQQAELICARQTEETEKAAAYCYTEGFYRTGYEVQKGLGVFQTMSLIDENRIKRLIAKPWTADGQTFKARCWTDKKKLIEAVNSTLTRVLITGETPQKAIDEITKRMNVSRFNAGRLIMTESAYFAGEAQTDSFRELGVKRYEIVSALDRDTCQVCGDMDGVVFKLSECVPGSTAPPFHPRCRCCKAPYFGDMKGERTGRDLEGNEITIPSDMTYNQWKAMQDEKYGEGAVDRARKMSYNESADREQYERYQDLLGEDAPENFEAFQKLKYDNANGYVELKTAYSDKGIQKRIQSNPAYTTLKIGQQGKHIIGHNNYTEGRSYLTVSMEEVQELIKQYAGTGEIRRDNSGKWTHKEFVTADKVIGYYVPPDGGDPVPTKRFSISYATGKKKGAHIVPAKEE